MIATLLKLIQWVVRSVFVSAVMFVIFYCIVTNTFPPDFSRLSTTYQNLQKLSTLAAPVASDEIKTDIDFTGEKDVDDLQAYNRKRQAFGEGLLPAKAQERTQASVSTNSKDSKDPDDVRASVQALQQEVFRLQQRVNELEEAAQERAAARITNPQPEGL